MLSHLPHQAGSEPNPPLSLNDLDSKLYDAAPHKAINLSLHSLDAETKSSAYQRRQLSRDAIRKHEMSIGGSMALIWRSMETIDSEWDDQNEQSLLNPSVNYANGHRHNQSMQKSLTSPNSAFTFNPNESTPNGGYHGAKNEHTQDVAVRSLIMFWKKVISTSAMGIQIWDILDDEADHTKSNGMFSVFGDSAGHQSHGKRLQSQTENANITGLSHSGWLSGESAFGVATQPFAHPFWLFTGHRQQIRIWKWNGFAFNTSCDCAACILKIDNCGYGNVRY